MKLILDRAFCVGLMRMPPRATAPSAGLTSIALLCALSVPGITQTSSPDATREREEGSIYAAIVRHVVEGKSGILFLRIAEKDPSDAVLGRIVRFELAIVPASRAIPEKPVRLLEPMKWRDRKTGLTGGLLELDAVEWATEKLVRVGGRVSERGKLVERDHGTFVVVKEAGRWRVKGFEEAIYY